VHPGRKTLASSGQVNVDSVPYRSYRAYRALFSGALTQRLSAHSALSAHVFPNLPVSQMQGTLWPAPEWAPQNVIGNERWLPWTAARAKTLLLAARHQNGRLRHKPLETEG
jgi:hypothetical protein